MSFFRIYSDGTTFLDNISQVGSKTFSTGTGSVSLNGATSITGSNSFSTGSGTVTIQGATLFSGIATTASGVASFDLSGGSGVFKTTTGSVTIGNGSISMTGSTAFSAGITASGSSNIDFSGTTGTFKTATGAVTIGNGTISMTGATTFSSSIAASGSGNMDFSGSTGTFKTSTGAVTIGSGAVTISGTTTITAATDALIVNNHIKVDGYRIDISAGAVNGQALVYNGTSFVATTPSGAVSSVSNSDSTLTISPTTGSVVASLNLGHANTWTAKQTFSNHIAIDGYTLDLSGGAASGQALVYNGTNFVPTTVEGRAGSGSNDLQLTTTSSTTVATYTPTTSGAFVVYVYYRVITATTNLTITLTWTDGTGSQTSNIVPSTTATIVGSYTAVPVYINSTTAAITVTAQAGTANQVFVSSNVVLL